MSYSLIRSQTRLIATLVVSVVLSVMLLEYPVSRSVWADEPAAALPDDADQDAADPDTANQAIEIPDGTVDELMAFISDTMKNHARDRESTKRAARAVTDAAAKVRTIDGVTLTEEIRAIGQQLSALQFLASIDPDAKAELKQVLETMSKDERPEISGMAAAEALKSEIAAVRTASKEERHAMVERVLGTIDKSGISISGYSLANMLARSLESAEETEMAASLYEEVAKRLGQSHDERLQGLAEKVLGSARRARLLGDEMEVLGQTADGDELDWTTYRGKVVLVDYWASWCGPCRGEVPNMKRNLDLYGDRGFTIIGINMDKTRDAYDKYVADEEISWVNLFPGNDEGKGWDHPMAVHYGVQAIPTAILVDREGKVVSLSARGRRLDTLLEELIGPAEPSDAASEEMSEN